jgi:hypothetical protein
MFVRVIRNVDVGDLVAISVCKPEIDDIDQMALAMSTYEKIIRLYITVDVMS